MADVVLGCKVALAWTGPPEDNPHVTITLENFGCRLSRQVLADLLNTTCPCGAQRRLVGQDGLRYLGVGWNQAPKEAQRPHCGGWT